MISLWQQLYSFLDALNAFHETIKFTGDISKTSVNFLDVKISQDEHGIITTDLYTKPLPAPFIPDIINRAYHTVIHSELDGYAVRTSNSKKLRRP